MGVTLRIQLSLIVRSISALPIFSAPVMCVFEIRLTSFRYHEHMQDPDIESTQIPVGLKLSQMISTHGITNTFRTLRSADRDRDSIRPSDMCISHHSVVVAVSISILIPEGVVWYAPLYTASTLLVTLAEKSHCNL